MLNYKKSNGENLSQIHNTFPPQGQGHWTEIYRWSYDSWVWKGREYGSRGDFGATKGKRKAPLGTQQVRDAFILAGYPFVSLELGQRCWFTAAHQISPSLSLFFSSLYSLSSLQVLIWLKMQSNISLTDQPVTMTMIKRCWPCNKIGSVTSSPLWG